MDFLNTSHATPQGQDMDLTFSLRPVGHIGQSDGQRRGGAPRTRVAVVGDVTIPTALSWVADAFVDCKVVLTTESYIADISPNRDPYDVLIVAGYDPKRLTKLLKSYQPLLQYTPKIALLDETAPQVRARLLNGGFDDVFSSSTRAEEMVARAKAILARYEVAQKNVAQRRSYGKPVTHALCKAPLTRREADVIDMLLERTPASVPVDVLRSGSPAMREIQASSLKVVISDLRKKLFEHAEILRTSTGYMIILEGDPNSGNN